MKLHELNIPLQSTKDRYRMLSRDEQTGPCPQCGQDTMDDEGACTECGYDGEPGSEDDAGDYAAPNP